MTNSDLRKRYDSVFDYHILFTHNNKTLLGGTYKRPGNTTDVFCYVPELDDFEKVANDTIVAFIRIINKKSKL